jgi:hypothetical protein
MQPRLTLRQRLLPRSDSNATTQSDASSSSTTKPAFGLFRLDVPPSGFPDSEACSAYKVDIIAIHGLGGDAFKTWTYEDGTLWLREYAGTEFPGARVYTFGYDSAFAFSQGTGKIRDFAKSLLEAINLERYDEEVCCST